MRTTANLRRDARIDVRIPVVVIRGSAKREHETLDVSFRGLFIACPEPPPLRSLVRLHVILTSRTIHVHAMAVHVVAADGTREGGAGLQFWGLSGTDRQAWEDFIRRLTALRRGVPFEMETPSGIRPVAHALSTGPRIQKK
jgi:hypothetical protein